ncbi:helix-turn-helix domain-containing protein [Dethiobacter alkaliphilus]|uniref:Helix-turn-helix domain-containing protein n=1 Tax=Dethiobacter alkaliphilus AHT 1 TaxID=555088 RepID=C0GET3_DETAL|nr:helix-turn-helix domain-containing protein [Dethiobacter alkaliphilus]EEG78115.1 hypothetical protein DealDRAFT_0992 [Dethiobacter alkaliphilus AHT 1]
MIREKLTISVEEAGQILGIGRSLAYKLAKERAFPVLPLGRKLVVPTEEFYQWIREKSKTA